MIPAGTVFPFAMQTIPDGFIECHGAEISRAVYSNLFAAIGTSWGSSSPTTFRLPDYRGKFLRGWNRGATGIDNGRIFGSTQGDAIRNITGSFEIRRTNAGGGDSTLTILSVQGAISRVDGAAAGNGVYGLVSDTAHRDRFLFSAGSVVPTADENRPVNEVVCWGIKY